MDVIRVRSIHTFPTRGEAGVEVESVRVSAAGLAGDRPKRAAVSLVGDDAPATRANLVLDVPTSQVEGLGGSLLRVGEVLLAAEPTGNACPGLYAAVGEEGWVRVGDVVQRA